MIHQIRWTAEKIAQRIALIEGFVYRKSHPISPFKLNIMDGPEQESPISPNFDDSGWQTVEANSYWIDYRTDFCLRSTFAVPADWDPVIPVALHLPLGDSTDFSHPEALAYLDGTPFAGCDRHHREILLPDHFRDEETHQLMLHGWTGLHGWFRGETDTKLFIRPCAVVQIDQPTRDFIATSRVALDTSNQLDKNNPTKDWLLNALNDAFNALDLTHPIGAKFYESVPLAHQILQDGISQAGQELDLDIVASGHAHIDVAWLWTIAQTRQKSGRTFHTVLRLMEQFPDYIFTQSQPQLYDYVRQDFPQLFEDIKQQVASGRWETIGGMWVEADCNLSGAEGLARQFLLGRAFFNEHFGPDVDSPILWLPDVFGYAWNLPQLIKLAGLEYFFTIKISWNQYNRMPYDSFWWQGLDGTKVLTHFSSTQDDWAAAKDQPSPSTYNAKVDPNAVMSTWNNLQHKAVQKEMLMAFGYGDGGGGPTREMLENIREMRSFPSTPKVRHGTAIEFFKNLEQSAGDKLPTWNGELYFEYHRGTYTTQAAAKKGNRKSEFLLHDAEFLATWAAIATDFEYPHETLTKAWQLTCLNQFHDILPGSSIKEVYEDAAVDYAEIQRLGESVRNAAIKSLVEKLPPDTKFVVINPTSFGGKMFASIQAGMSFAEGEGLIDLKSGKPIARQKGIAHNPMVMEIHDMEPYSIRPIGIGLVGPPEVEQRVWAGQEDGLTRIENALIRYQFDASGEIVSIFDKEVQREILPDGEKANVFQAFEDRPMKWDAWDIDIFYDDKEYDAGPAGLIWVTEEGPLRASLRLTREILNSTIQQIVHLHADSKQLDFHTGIEWQEKHTLLKVAFPVDVLSPMATFDVQWGNVERPTHRNTSWDWARFESCAHKWVDLSEGDYGVSLLNDCKYGHDIWDNVIRLTLLRAPSHPDQDADQGHHEFSYSLLPHTGSWKGKTAAAAYALNDPLIVQQVEQNGDGSLAESLVQVDQPNVIIETVKQAEDGNGVIVRLYENERVRGPITLTTGFDLSKATMCNLLEDAVAEEVQILNPRQVQFSIRPYEIKTIRLS